MDKEDLRKIFDEARMHLSLSPQSPKSILSGDWDSEFIGEGMEFEEFREYRIGDNPKRIHAAMSSRMGKPMVIRHLEPRESRCLIVLDATPSMRVREKMKVAFAALGMIFSSAHEVHMPIGIWALGNNRELDMRPPVTHTHMEYVIDAICGGGEDENPYLRERVSAFNFDTWNIFLPGGSFIFVISDFLGGPDSNFMQLFRDDLYGYKVVPVVVQDDLEHTFPEIPSSGAEVPLLDPESNIVVRTWIDQKRSKAIRQKHEDRFQDIKAFFEDRYISIAHISDVDMNDIYGKLQYALL